MNAEHRTLATQLANEATECLDIMKELKAAEKGAWSAALAVAVQCMKNAIKNLRKAAKS